MTVKRIGYEANQPGLAMSNKIAVTGNVMNQGERHDREGTDVKCYPRRNSNKIVMSYILLNDRIH